jgi:hypothetical protein
MKFSLALIASLLASASAFQLGTGGRALPKESAVESSRSQFLKTLTASGVATAASLLFQEPAFARGRATLEQSYQRYSPRVISGGNFYGSELKNLVAKNDWEGIKNSLLEPPERTKKDLQKPDAGVAERARLAGGFSDARVLTAADLYAGAFSDSSVSAKTKKMQADIQKVRAAVQGMQGVAKQGLGEESGGLFGLGGKKLSEAELSKQMKEYYTAGGNAWNEYVLAANDGLALKFDRFPFIN